MNNLLSYCGLVDARISASEKDLPVLRLTPYKDFLTEEAYSHGGLQTRELGQNKYK